MSENIEGMECPFKVVKCHKGCAAYALRYRSIPDFDGETEEPYMICLILEVLNAISKY